MTAARARHLNPFLAIAIVAVPVVFVWGLLWPGHARSTRRAGFIYAGEHLRTTNSQGLISLVNATAFVGFRRR